MQRKRMNSVQIESTRKQATTVTSSDLSNSPKETPPRRSTANKIFSVVVKSIFGLFNDIYNTASNDRAIN